MLDFVCIYVCVGLSTAANEGGGKEVVYEEGKQSREWTFQLKGHPNSSNFQANQRGTGWTLIGWSEGCERSLKGYRGHRSPAQITCPSFLRMTYPCKVSRTARQRRVINVSLLHTFCLGETNAAFTENRHSSSGQGRN